MASTADNDDDFDVIYENSPLYWSMLDAGLEEVGQEDVCKKTDQSLPTGTVWNTTSSSKKFFHSIYSKWFLPVTAPFTFNVDSTELTKYLRGNAFKEVASSALLTEEDALFLRDMTVGSSNHMLCIPSFFKRKMLALLVAFFLCLLGSALPPWLPSLPWLKAAVNSAFVLVLTLFAIQIMVIMKSRAAQRAAEDFQERLRIVLSAATKCLDLAAKCVRFIQESELVVRGFTFVGSSATSKVLNEFQMTPRQRQCPKLREKLFVMSKALFFVLRKAFLQVVRQCPVSLELSGVVRYCSEIPLEQYPEMLHEDADTQASLAKLHDITDGFSIHVLKSMQELNRIHVSEFVRRLAVCLALDDEDCDPLFALEPVLQKMIKDLERLHRGLQTHLDAHRHSSLHISEERIQKAAAWQPTSSLSQLQQTYTALHSLELHLLAALKKVQNISEAMERKLDGDMMETDQNKTSQQQEIVRKGEIEEPYRDAWNQILQLVRSEISACSGCLDEGITQLQKKNTTEPVSAGSLLQQPLSPTASSNSRIVKVSAQDNPIILDEVFEAFSEPQECGYDEYYQFTSAEEEAWHKRQKRDLKLCLNELQAIINIRAAETHERERIALDRMKSASSTTNADQHQPRLRGETQGNENHLNSVQDKTNSGAEKVSCGNTDDLTKDIEERVEFWKQFDLKEQAAISRGCAETDDSEKEDASGSSSFISACRATEDRMDGTTGSIVQNMEEHSMRNQSVKTLGSEIDEVHSLVHISSSFEESNFVTGQKSKGHLQESVSTRKKDTAEAGISQTSESKEVITYSNQVHTDEADVQTLSGNPFSNENQFLSENDNHLEEENTFIRYLVEEENCLATGNKEGKTKSPLTDENTPAIKGAHDSQSEEIAGSDAESDAVCRTQPEGTAEHLSLPAAPSPFAFSIASLVASRARNFAQTEDTFGDSSSDEGAEDADS